MQVPFKPELHPSVIVEYVPIEEDDDLREPGSPLRNETPSEWECMDPICVRKFLSFLFINRQTLMRRLSS